MLYVNVHQCQQVPLGLDLYFVDRTADLLPPCHCIRGVSPQGQEGDSTCTMQKPAYCGAFNRNSLSLIPHGSGSLILYMGFLIGTSHQCTPILGLQRDGLTHNVVHRRPVFRQSSNVHLDSKA